MTQSELAALYNTLNQLLIYKIVKQNILNIAQDYQAGIIDKAAAGDALQKQFNELPQATAIAMFTFVLTQVDELIVEQEAILTAANITEDEE